MWLVCDAFHSNAFRNLAKQEAFVLAVLKTPLEVNPTDEPGGSFLINADVSNTHDTTRTGMDVADADEPRLRCARPARLHRRHHQAEAAGASLPTIFTAHSLGPFTVVVLLLCCAVVVVVGGRWVVQ